MNFKDYLKNNIVYLDGGMGTLLQEKGLTPGEHPEMWSITHPDVITDIHCAYFDAGSNVVCSNTFGANSLKFSDEELECIISSAINCAKKAKQKSISPQEKFIALDIGPTGKLLKPLGDLDFCDAVSVFSKTVSLGVKYGADLIVIETMNDSYETKAALLAAKENSDLPVIVTNAYGEDKKLMTGATPQVMVALIEGMGADALGANCSLGPKQLKDIAAELIKYSSIPVVIKPNAGLPEVRCEKTVFNVGPSEFSEDVTELIKSGVRVVGGCCGTTPEYIMALTQKSSDLSPLPVTEKNISMISSYTHAVAFGSSPVLIGERINPTGKKRFKQALIEHDIDYILKEGINQEEKGVHVLDVNVGLPDIDENELLSKTICELQSVTNLPLQIDTADIYAMENALMLYNGKAMINSVNGKEESMNAVFPLVKKYGGLVVALTLDESGIPDTADGRVQIAKKILSRAKDYGISKKDIIFDPLAMTISADTNSATVTLEAIRRIKEELGCLTSLGVSNVSFGLPNRDAINGTFFTMALSAGLDAAIMNPYSVDMIKSYYTYKALSGMDSNCEKYIRMADSFKTEVSNCVSSVSDYAGGVSELQRAIVKGLKENAAIICEKLLDNTEPLEIVQNEIIPSLNIVGKGFEEKTVYLPQLLMSAEAAKSAFEKIKEKMPKTASAGEAIVLATVYGDIHDIGKNIVKLLLENYGYNVVDLGKDVPSEDIVKKTQLLHAPVVGLSALMTTTVPAMEETINALHKHCPWCKVIVGGAVLTQEYADKIGADKYANDAMEAVRYAQTIIK